MTLKTLARPVAGALLTTMILSGCVSPQLLEGNQKAVDTLQASSDQMTDSLYARMRRDRAAIERAQEVDKPFLAGRAVPTSRNVTLPLALRKDVDTLIVFPDRSMPLAVAGQRITMATGIPVKIENDVYLPPAALMPRGAAAATANSRTANGSSPSMAPTIGPAPTLGGPLPAGLASAAGGTANQAVPLVETALNVEFKQSEKMPLATMLDLIATRLSINWEYVPSKSVIRFYRLSTKMWQLPIRPGKSSFTTEFRQTTQANGTSGSAAGQAVQIDTATKAEAKDLDDFENIGKSIEPVLTVSGSMSINPSTGLLALTDTKEAVDRADEIVRKQIAIYSRMVYAKFQTVDFTITDSGQAGADWNVLLTKALQHVPGFSLTALSPTSLVGADAGSVGMSITSGGFNGTQAIINALKQYGTATTSTTVPIAMRNRHGAQYNTRRQFTYVSNTTPAASTVGGTGGTPGITTSTGTVGFKLALFPDATSRDDVNMTIAFDKSDLDGPIQSRTSGTGAFQQTVEVPKIAGNGINGQEVTVRNGQTVIVTAFDQNDTSTTHRTLAEHLPLLTGGSLAATRSRTFTLVLLTVMVQDQGALGQ